MNHRNFRCPLQKILGLVNILFCFLDNRRVTGVRDVLVFSVFISELRYYSQYHIFCFLSVHNNDQNLSIQVSLYLFLLLTNRSWASLLSFYNYYIHPFYFLYSWRSENFIQMLISGWRDTTIGRAYALYVANPGLIPSTTYNPFSYTRVFSKHRARSKLWALPVQNKCNCYPIW